ncbi:MAG: hypothetical protein HYW07_21375 [Candidatus Latescibacteria bacterium]|nr:hypothetical protein [Candidatus Latescibacterota bacterium]
MTRRIFLSSVQRELAEERRAVRDFVHSDPLLAERMGTGTRLTLARSIQEDFARRTHARKERSQ